MSSVVLVLPLLRPRANQSVYRWHGRLERYWCKWPIVAMPDTSTCRPHYAARRVRCGRRTATKVDAHTANDLDVGVNTRTRGEFGLLRWLMSDVCVAYIVCICHDTQWMRPWRHVAAMCLKEFEGAHMEPSTRDRKQRR
ncbi:hypothetical protein ColLi_09351 [Colletotrichum liriopes]|uniref:Uncharacterized protein n=1 Tax=Colletotrichum liriopes TaxID=708192 RepID=A0AA37GUV1_9PEZI|nr:hypothetical protein ColLi_09351 [Colletotrichum liriopes]